MSFSSQATLEMHLKSHISCRLCDFSATQRVVKVHYEKTHGKYSGKGLKRVKILMPGCVEQKFDVCVGDDKEDVRKWIAERRKNFPTMERILQKRNKKDEEVVLGGLLNAYESTDDEKGIWGNDDEVKKDGGKKPANKESKIVATSKKSKRSLCHYFLRGKCKNGDNCQYSHDQEEKERAIKKRKETGPNQRGSKRKMVNYSGSTLLKKLLETEMHRETSLTLQCLHYISKRNFMQDGKHKNATSNDLPLCDKLQETQDQSIPSGKVDSKIDCPKESLGKQSSALDLACHQAATHSTPNSPFQNVIEAPVDQSISSAKVKCKVDGPKESLREQTTAGSNLNVRGVSLVC